MNLGVPVRTVRVKKPEDEHLNDSVGTTTMMERTGKSGIGFPEAFIQFQVTSKDQKKDNRMAGFSPQDVEFRAAGECERRHVSRDERDGGMSAMA